MTPEQLQAFTRQLVAQGEAYNKSLIDLAIYSNGSVTYNDILQMPLNQIKMIETSVSNKIKSERGIKEQAML